jgi:hypothetical protein
MNDPHAIETADASDPMNALSPRLKTNFRASTVDAVSGVFEHSGFLNKRSDGLVKRWQKRYFTLSGHHLSYFINQPCNGDPSPDLKGNYDLRTLSGTDVDDRRLILQFDGSFSACTCELQADTKADAVGWQNALTEAAASGQQGAAQDSTRGIATGSALDDAVAAGGDLVLGQPSPPPLASEAETKIQCLTGEIKRLQAQLAALKDSAPAASAPPAAPAASAPLVAAGSTRGMADGGEQVHAPDLSKDTPFEFEALFEAFFDTLRLPRELAKAVQKHAAARSVKVETMQDLAALAPAARREAVSSAVARIAELLDKRLAGMHFKTDLEEEAVEGTRREFMVALSERIGDQPTSENREKLVEIEATKLFEDNPTAVKIRGSPVTTAAGFFAKVDSWHAEVENFNQEDNRLMQLFKMAATPLAESVKNRQTTYAGLLHRGYSFLVKRALRAAEDGGGVDLYHPLHSLASCLEDQDKQWKGMLEPDQTGFRGFTSFAPTSLTDWGTSWHASGLALPHCAPVESPVVRFKSSQGDDYSLHAPVSLGHNGGWERYMLPPLTLFKVLGVQDSFRMRTSDHSLELVLPAVWTKVRGAGSQTSIYYNTATGEESLQQPVAGQEILLHADPDQTGSEHVNRGRWWHRRRSGREHEGKHGPPTVGFVQTIAFEPVAWSHALVGKLGHTGESMALLKGPAPSAATATTATTTTADWLEVVGDKVRGKAVLLEGRFDGADAEQEAKAQVALLAQHGAAAVLFADPAAPHAPATIVLGGACAHQGSLRGEYTLVEGRESDGRPVYLKAGEAGDRGSDLLLSFSCGRWVVASEQGAAATHVAMKAADLALYPDLIEAEWQERVVFANAGGAEEKREQKMAYEREFASAPQLKFSSGQQPQQGQAAEEAPAVEVAEGAATLESEERARKKRAKQAAQVQGRRHTLDNTKKPAAVTADHARSRPAWVRASGGGEPGCLYGSIPALVVCVRSAEQLRQAQDGTPIRWPTLEVQQQLITVQPTYLVTKRSGSGGCVNQTCRLMSNPTMLKYGGRTQFGRGLAEIVSKPVLTMEQEFMRDDRWTSWNGAEHSGAAEWLYVAPGSAAIEGVSTCVGGKKDHTPERDQGNGGKTAEDFLVEANGLIKSGLAGMRQEVHHAAAHAGSQTVQQRRKSTRVQKTEVVEDTNLMLVLEEVVALRLYSGPAFTPINQFLREVANLSRDWRVRLARDPNITFSATVGWLISGIRKLSRVTKLTTLYRGVKGKLPDAFDVPDMQGMVSATDSAFMSTSRSQLSCIKFMSKEQPNVMWELACKEEGDAHHNGADIEILSQFPGEEEVLFPPLTMLVAESAPTLGVVNETATVDEGSAHFRRIAVVPYYI